MNNQTVCGGVALVGRPNVGKSTLLNHLVGYKLSAIANKPQTTRTNIKGILTESDKGYQIIFIDTPGIHKESKTLLNFTLNKEAIASIEEVDVVVHLIEVNKWTDEDEDVLSRYAEFNKPVFLAINKIDRVEDKNRLLPFIQSVMDKYEYAGVIPISATKAIQTDELLENIVARLPKGPFVYDEDHITDKSVKFICAELVREQLVINLHQELPYSTAVQVERYKEEDDLVKLDVIIWTDREPQKGIIIGKNGQTLKRIGSAARVSLEEFLMKKVMLRQWVKVEKNWQNNPNYLNELGIVSTKEL